MATVIEEKQEGYSNAAYIYQSNANVKDLVWDDTVKRLKDFVASYRLPLVARVLSGDLSKYLPPCGSDEENVVQIHELRRRKIVLARRLQWEKRQNDYIVSGEQVEVPACFKGWFEVLPRDGRPVEYFDTVGGICNIKPHRFLVRTSTVVYQLSIEDGASCWMPHEICPGEVLTTGMVYVDGNNNKKGKGGNATSNKSFLKRLLKSSKSKNKPEHDLKYLQCFDAGGREIMIPLIMSGVFSPVGDASGANYDAVYELQDLILAFGLPVNAQLVHADSKETSTCPQGVLRLYGTREEELAVISQVGKDGVLSGPAAEQVEISVDRDLFLQRGMPRRKQSVHSVRPHPITSESSLEINTVASSDPPGIKKDATVGLELPKRLPKELKKSKSTGLLDKLSVRKVRKERAKLKELRSDDVFSKRIVRSDMSYEDFFKGLDREEDKEEVKSKNCNVETSEKHSLAGSETQTNGAGRTTNAKEKSSSVYGKSGETGSTTRRQSIQERDLPPIPAEESLSSLDAPESIRSSKDSLYEHLPPAPKPPSRCNSERVHVNVEAEFHLEEDDYMVPLSLPEDISVRSAGSEVHLRWKPPTVPRSDSAKYSRSKKCKSDVIPGLAKLSVTGDSPMNCTNSKEPHNRSSSVMATPHWAGSTSQIYGYRTHDRHGMEVNAVPSSWHDDPAHFNLHNSNSNSELGTLTRKSVEQLDLETRSSQGGRYVPRSQRNLQMNSNATIRSHNLRDRHGSFFELFHFSDSFRDLRDSNNVSDSNSTVSSHSHIVNPTPAGYPPQVVLRSRHSFLGLPSESMRSSGGMRDGEVSRAGENPYGTVVMSPYPSGSSHSQDVHPMSPVTFYPRPRSNVPYAESEPAYGYKYQRTTSVTGLSDSAYPKQGNDSAISMGSRAGDYVFNNDSEYSYNDYNENGSGSIIIDRDDNWTPPDDISGLSVQEISKSLRYIGMKDRVALRFANEQIDGNMLCSLDKRLLKEGFPELNALEIKKILDFVRGWRPKKK